MIPNPTNYLRFYKIELKELTPYYAGRGFMLESRASNRN